MFNYSVILIMAAPALLQAIVPDVRIDADVALEFINASNEKVHALFVGTNYFRHLLDAGGWTNKAVASMITISEDVFKLIPDVDGASMSSVAGGMAADPETWVTAIRGILKAGQFFGNVFPHVAIAAIKHKDYFVQVHQHLSKCTYLPNSYKKKPASQISGLNDLTVAIFPDDEHGVAKFEMPLYVRSFNHEKYNALQYGPEHGHAYFMKVDFATGRVLKKTEKVYLPLRYNKKTDSVEVPEEGEDILGDLIAARRKKK